MHLTEPIYLGIRELMKEPYLGLCRGWGFSRNCVGESYLGLCRGWGSSRNCVALVIELRGRIKRSMGVIWEPKSRIEPISRRIRWEGTGEWKEGKS